MSNEFSKTKFLWLAHYPQKAKSYEYSAVKLAEEAAVEKVAVSVCSI